MSVDFVNARYEKEEGPPNTWAQLEFSAGLYLRSFFKLFKWERVTVAHILVTHSYLLKRVWPPPVMSWGRCCMRIFCFFAQSTLPIFAPITHHHTIPYPTLPAHTYHATPNPVWHTVPMVPCCTKLYHITPEHGRPTMVQCSMAYQPYHTIPTIPLFT